MSSDACCYDVLSLINKLRVASAASTVKLALASHNGNNQQGTWWLYPSYFHVPDCCCTAMTSPIHMQAAEATTGRSLPGRRAT